MDDLEGKFGNRGQFDTAREYSDDLMSRIGRYASEQIKKSGKEAEKWERGLEMISLLLETGIAGDDIIRQSGAVIERIESGESESDDVKKEIAATRKKAEWVFEASKKIHTKEGEMHREIRSALEAIDETLRRSGS